MSTNKKDPGTAAMPADREMQALIGHRLRARYAEILAEPIPDRFLDLLEQLDGPVRSEKGRGGGGGGASSTGSDASMRGVEPMTVMMREEHRR